MTGEQLPNVLNMTVHDIERCVQNKFWYAALVLALSIPGICSSLEKEKGWSGRDEYIDWCERYICKKLSVPSAVLYQVRCGVVHQGRGGFSKEFDLWESFGLRTDTEEAKVTRAMAGKAKRVIFLTGDGTSGIHGNQFGDAVQLDSTRFCSDMIDCLNDWIKDTKDDAIVQSNANKLLRYYPTGATPTMPDVPAIA